MDPDKERDKQREQLRGVNKIGRLKQRMYSRARRGFIPWRRRHNIRPENQVVKDNWQYEMPEHKEYTVKQYADSKSSVAWIVFTISFMLFILAAIAALSYLYFSKPVVDEGIDVKVEGFTSIASGEVVEMQVVVTNRNTVPLDYASLVIKYPDGTISPADYRTPLSGERIPLGKIDARSARRGTVRAVFLGNSGDVREVQFAVQYRVKGSSVLHASNARHTVTLSSDALTVTVDGNHELIPGKESVMTVHVRSHAASVVHNVFLEVAYPFGFKIKDASPKHESITDDDGTDGARWELGLMRPGDERTVQLTGVLDGQVGDERELVFNAGYISKQGRDTEVSYQLASAQHDMTLHKPFITARLVASGGRDLSQYIAHAGQPIEIELRYKNNLSVPVDDVTVALTLGGSALNKGAVNAKREGFYRSVDSLIIWDKKTAGAKLARLSPGEGGKFSFSVTPLPTTYLQRIREPQLSFKVHIAGNRMNENNVPEVVKREFTRVVKVGTDVMTDARAYFSDGPFGSGRGPLPPKVEYETTYTVTWDVNNTSSDLHDVSVTADIPHYVRWQGVKSPASEQVIYNKTQRTITWHLGDVRAGTGVNGRKPRSVSFTLGLVPSASQVGTSPEIITNQHLSGTDAYTGEQVTRQLPTLTTRDISDAQFADNAATVVQ